MSIGICLFFVVLAAIEIRQIKKSSAALRNEHRAYTESVRIKEKRLTELFRQVLKAGVDPDEANEILDQRSK